MNRKMIVLAAFLVVLLIPGMAPSASASNAGGAEQIGGEAILVAECGGESSLLTFEMTGSLVG